MSRASKVPASPVAAKSLSAAALPPAASSSAAPPNLFIGTSGWAYPTWKPDFYPAKVPAKKFLEFYASQLNSVEVNYNFRALPTLKMLEGWLAASHASFRLRRSAVYSSAEIAAFATRFNALAQQRATYIYFKHEDEPTGALSATALLAAAAAEAGLRG